VWSVVLDHLGLIWYLSVFAAILFEVGIEAGIWADKA
jgi:hypothetical protein